MLLRSLSVVFALIGLVIMAGLAYAAPAASTGEFHFTGTIAKASCTLSNNGKYNIDFGKVSTVAFGTQKNHVAAIRNFNIELKNCDLTGYASNDNAGEQHHYQSVLLTFSDTNPAPEDNYVGVKFGNKIANDVAIQLASYNASSSNFSWVPMKGITPTTIPEIPLQSIASGERAYDIPMQARLVNLKDTNVSSVGYFTAAVNFSIEYK